MNVKKIAALSDNTLSKKIKHKTQQMRAALKQSEEKRFSKLLRQTAQTILPPRKIANLTVGNADVYVPSESIIQNMSAKLDMSDSIWAPWSTVGKIKK